MKFAHLADCHLGAFHDPVLRDLNLQAFLEALDKCMEHQVDFIVIAGDLFHTPVPDLDVVKTVVQKMRELKENGIEVYLLSGSHDANPTSTTITDVIRETGFYHSLDSCPEENDGLSLRFIEDPNTGVLVTGLAGKRKGQDAEDYARLDRPSLEGRDGFKVFVFHNYVSGIGTGGLPGIQLIEIDDLPRWFAYYAGGHTHSHLYYSEGRSRPHIVYPGALFGSSVGDLEETATGTARGFYLVTGDKEQVTGVDFCRVGVCAIEFVRVDVEGMSAEEASSAVRERVHESDCDGQVVLLKVSGRLSEGRAYQLHLRDIASEMKEQGALTVVLNTRSLRGEVPDFIRDDSATEGIITAEFERAMGEFEASNLPGLSDTPGVDLAEKLLDLFRGERDDSETKTAYKERVQQEAQALIDTEVVT